jgi:hypothetical protein
MAGHWGKKGKIPNELDIYGSLGHRTSQEMRGPKRLNDKLTLGESS